MTHQKGIRSLPYGIWPAEMARLFPQAHIVGVDISAASLGYPCSSSCTFCLADVLKGLPFPEQQFEYVHQRLLVAAIPAVNWPAVIRELIRVTRPGGWVELLEMGVTLQHAGPETTRLLTWMEEQSKVAHPKFVIGVSGVVLNEQKQILLLLL